jgi:cell division protein FtsI (penicillin-binding protein 3)
MAGILDDRDEDDAASAAPPDTPGPRIPNFRGMTLRAVMTEASAKGLRVVADGSGIASAQEPAPGSPLREGERVRVVFAR